MRKGFKWLGVLAVPVVAAGGVYGYYWYQVKHSVDQIIQALGPYASVDYDSVVAGLDGNAGIKGVRITPAGSREPVMIDSMLLQAPDPLFYFTLRQDVRDGHWPERLALSVRGIQLDLGADYAKRWQRLAESMEKSAEGGVDLEALGCGDIQRFDLRSIRAMGYQRLRMDMNTVAEFVPARQRLRLNSDLKVEGLAQTGVTLDFALRGGALSASTLSRQPPTLKRVTVDYSDLGYNSRRNAFCAKQANIEPADYAAHHSTLVQAELKRQGWTIPDPLIKAYADLQRPRAILQLSAEPPAGFGPGAVGKLKSPEQLLDLFGLQVRINGAKQDLSGVHWSLGGDKSPAGPSGEAVSATGPSQPVAPKVAAKAPEQATSPAGKAAPEKTPAKPKQPDLVVELEPRKPASAQQEVKITDPNVVEVMPGIVVKTREKEKTYKPTPVSQAGGYTGQPIKLRTYFGRHIEGKLVKVQDGTLEVQQRLGKGVAIFPIAANKVAELSIYR